MRNLLAVLAFVLFTAPSSPAQDPAAQAAQQAMQQSQQAAQQAMQQAQQFSMQAAQQAQQDAQRAQQDAINAANAANSGLYQPYFGFTSTPKFSVKPGAYSSPTRVKITDATRGAIIYYTTDGWTPTASSPRYMGPITISSTTTLQAVAIAPNFQRSFVAIGKYTMNNSTLSQPVPTQSQTAHAAPQIPPGEKLLLPQGTPVLLAFAADVNSHTASVGDQIPMTVTRDVQQDGVVLIKTGTPAVGTVIQVDKNTAFGLPGVLSFKVDYLDLNGTLIRLCGEAAREGEAKPPNAAILIPVVGPLTALRRGTDAVIKQGTPFTAFLYGDTPLAPAP
jgi:Chitobiase/beta-hexosaminidase C-terminal domain